MTSNGGNVVSGLIGGNAMFTGGVDAASGQRRCFVIGWHNCCACKGGSNAYVMITALGSPLGAWRYVDDICRREHPVCDTLEWYWPTDGGCYQGGHSPLQINKHR